jgi:hypothetical protein
LKKKRGVDRNMKMRSKKGKMKGGSKRDISGGSEGY